MRKRLERFRLLLTREGGEEPPGACAPPPRRCSTSVELPRAHTNWTGSVKDGNGLVAALAAGLLSLTACQESAQSDKFDGAMVLAMSWQPAFCERASRKQECRTQKPGRYDTDHFSLHGLWPQPGNNIYCGVKQGDVKTDKNRRWKRLEALGLSDSLRKRLGRIMPGVFSYLHRHEWIKHGTCYAVSPEVYFTDSLILMDQINTSAVRDLFAANIGRKLTGPTIRKAFNSAFGQGTGARVRISCRRDGGREIITEITLGLKGTISKKPDMAALINASPKIHPGCPGGIVDPVGLQ